MIPKCGQCVAVTRHVNDVQSVSRTPVASETGGGVVKLNQQDVKVSLNDNVVKSGSGSQVCNSSGLLGREIKSKG